MNALRALLLWQRARHKRFSADPERQVNAHPDGLLAPDRQPFEDRFRTAIVARRTKK